VRAHFAGMRYGDLKKQVAEAVISHLEPIQARLSRDRAEPGYIAGGVARGRRTRVAVGRRHGEQSAARDGIYTV